jgi:hypothetical protein
MEMEQMMECMQAGMKTSQAKTDANLKEIKEVMRAGREMLTKL